MELVDMRDLGSRAFRRWGSSPHARTTSPRTTYRSRRLFYKSHLSLILSRLLSKPDPLSLGSGLGPPLRGGFVLSQGSIDFTRPFQPAASDISLATSFFISSQSSSRAHFAAPRYQTGPAVAGLRFGMPPCGRFWFQKYASLWGSRAVGPLHPS